MFCSSVLASEMRHLLLDVAGRTLEPDVVGSKSTPLRDTEGSVRIQSHRARGVMSIHRLPASGSAARARANEGRLPLTVLGSLRIVCEPMAMSLAWNLILDINRLKKAAGTAGRKRRDGPA